MSHPQSISMAEVRDYITGFVSAIVAVIIAVNLVPTLLTAVANVSGVPLLTSALVGTIVGAGNGSAKYSYHHQFSSVHSQRNYGFMVSGKTFI